MSKNGKGDKVAGDFRTPQWEESKLWYQNDVAEIGQINIKAGHSVAGEIKMKNHNAQDRQKVEEKKR